MKAPSPAFSLYPKDILTDQTCAAMSDEEFGAYVRLLLHAWLEGSIPADRVKLMRLMRRRPSSFARVWPAIAPCFTLVKDRLFQMRLEKEKSKQVERSYHQQQRALKAAKSRAINKGAEPDDSSGTAHRQPTTSLASPSPSPSPSPQQRQRQEEKGAHAHQGTTGLEEIQNVFAEEPERPPVYQVSEGAANQEPEVRQKVSRGSGQEVETEARSEPDEPTRAEEGVGPVEGERVPPAGQAETSTAVSRPPLWRKSHTRKTSRRLCVPARGIVDVPVASSAASRPTAETDGAGGVAGADSRAALARDLQEFLRNPNVDRGPDEARGHALIQEIAQATGLAPIEVLSKTSAWNGRSYVRLDTMSDDRLAHTLNALRAWRRRLKGEPEPTPPRKVDRQLRREHTAPSELGGRVLRRDLDFRREDE